MDGEERTSRDWLLGPRGGSLEPWEEAAAHLPGGADNLGAVVCVPQTAPTIWVRDDAIDDPAVWDALRSLVTTYDAGERDPEIWTAVLGGAGHLAVLAAG